MKLTFVFFIVSILHVTAAVYSQSAIVSIDAENISLERLFSEIERQADVKFLFRHENVDGKMADIRLKNAPIDQVLNNVLPANGLKHSLIGENLIAIASSVQLQGIVVSGTVTDESGEPIPGVNITVKGTLTGVISDVAGNYSISVPGNDAVLVFSFVGYTVQEVAVGEKRNIGISLREAVSAIEEVVVIGYGTQRRSLVTSAISKLTIDESTKRQVASPSQLLNGQIGRASCRERV